MSEEEEEEEEEGGGGGGGGRIAYTSVKITIEFNFLKTIH